jgi:signal transduction histidine kinase
MPGFDDKPALFVYRLSGKERAPAVTRCIPVHLTVLAVLACATLSIAHPAAISQADSNKSGYTSKITFGPSLAPLYGPWKFHVGDSPLDSITHKPLWAEPGFDDSQWETVDLTAKPKARGAVLADRDYSAGWTAKGHPAYWGFAWYRIRVQLNVNPAEKLALAGPADVDDAYQVFSNGLLLGSFGDFSQNEPVTYHIQPMMFELQQAAAGTAGSRTFVLAFRVWMAPFTLGNSSDPGGMHSAPLLGEASAITTACQLVRTALFRFYAAYAVEAFLYVLLAVVAFSLILFDRSDQVYIWIGSVFLLTALEAGLTAFDVWTQHLSIQADSLIADGFLAPVASAGWGLMWWVWFGRQRMAWLPRVAAGLAILYIISNAIGKGLLLVGIPPPVTSTFVMISLIIRLVFGALLLWIVIEGIRCVGLEGWSVLPAIVLLGIGAFQNELSFLIWFPFGVRINLAQVAHLLLAAVVALLLLRRLLLSVRRQRLISFTMKQAQLQADFVAAVSHEFRSPLTTLRTITELLVQNRIPDEARRQQSYVFLDHETSRLHRLVEELLDFRRRESGSEQYILERHDVIQLVRAALDDFGELAAAQGFRIETDIGRPRDPFTVKVDEEAFRRAVRNLLDNAMKYSPVCRTVWVNASVQNDSVLISVRDEGMGIDADEEQVIFQKFVRGDAAKRAGIKGTGIGLTMVQQISEAMGGEVRLQSQPGVGSTFTIVLPLAED